MKEIIVLWSYADDPTIPPPVCPDTSRTVKEVVMELRNHYSGKGLIFTYSDEISMDRDKTGGVLTIGGIRLEELVPLPDPSKYCGMACGGCGTGETGGHTPCPCSRIYEQIPESVLRLALAKAAEKCSGR